MRKNRYLYLLCLLLCQCATKHQPIAFVPYFPTTPESQLSDSQLVERAYLESRPARTPGETKRLYELYASELAQLKPTSSRFADLNSSAEKLRASVASDLDGMAQLRLEWLNRKRDTKETKILFSNESLKAEYQIAYNLWNSDQNEGALQKINAIQASEVYKDKASRGEKFKIQSLRFRIFSDLGNVEESGKAYEALRSHEDCAPETTQAGFLMAVLYMGSNEGKKALEVFERQCDKDDSPSNKLRRRYWHARFKEAATGEKEYAEIVQTELPGYYVYLSAARAGLGLSISGASPDDLKYLSLEFETSAKVHAYLVEAENRLKSGLRKDARLFLDKAAELLSRDPDEGDRIPLLYTAQLFHAAGDHLGAMKIYAIVTRNFTKRDPIYASFLTADFFKLMFPRPFEEEVEFHAKLWDIPPDFIYAIMRQESAFNPGAVSRTSARGLMQLMPPLAKSIAESWSAGAVYSEKLLFKAPENLRLAAIHLRNLKAWGGHLALIAGAYNAGTRRTMGWWQRRGTLPLDVFVERIPITETRDYVKLVLRNYVCYRLLRSGGKIETNLFPLVLPPAPAMAGGK